MSATALTGATLTAAPASARGRPLEAVTLGGDKIRLDGLLREWPAKLDTLGDVVQGSGGGDPSATGAIGYDDKNVHVALKVKDSKFVRTASYGDGEDYASLELAIPTERGFRSYSVRLYAGEIGKSAGSVRLNGEKVKGAKIVEAPAEGGYTIEAAIPWSTFPEASRVRVGLRAALRYWDADSPGKVSTVIATGTGTGASLPPLLLEAEMGLYRTLVRKKGLPSMPARFGVGDIAGDDKLEAVAIYGSALTILGSAYRGGKEYFYQDLAIAGPDDISRFEVTDLTGDGKAEILIERKVVPPKVDEKPGAKSEKRDKRDTKNDYRTVLQVFRVSSGENPYIAFQRETGIVTKEGEIHNEVTLKPKGGKIDIVVSQGKAHGFDPNTYSEPISGDMDSAILPWNTMKSQSYEWNGKEFAAIDTENWQPVVQAPAPKVAASSASATEAAPPPPRPPSADELLDRVYALYRQDHKVGVQKPRFDFVADVAADGTPERVLVHGKDLVVFGKGFKEGTSYVYMTVGVEAPKDITDVTARDLTGDGKAEIIVRGVLHAKASKQMGGKVVDRQAYYVYQSSESGMRRIFAAETGRALEDDAIVGTIRYVPAGKATLLEMNAGRAVGWSETTYPFPVDKLPWGGLEPLLVPWGEQKSRRYHYDGSAYVAE